MRQQRRVLAGQGGGVHLRRQFFKPHSGSCARSFAPGPTRLILRGRTSYVSYDPKGASKGRWRGVGVALRWRQMLILVVVFIRERALGYWGNWGYIFLLQKHIGFYIICRIHGINAIHSISFLYVIYFTAIHPVFHAIRYMNRSSIIPWIAWIAWTLPPTFST